MLKAANIGRVLKVGLLVGMLSSSGCVATVGVDKASIPKDAAQTCSRHCGSIGMRLTAVAIMAENVGCVCQGGAATASPEAAGPMSTPAAGMATIAIQQAAAVAALQAQQRQQQLQRLH